jgi:integrase/recombinase XerD
LTNPYDFRNRVILEVFYGTGIRAGELVNLELRDFYREERLLFVRKGKGGKDRVLPMGEHAFKYLVKYVKEVRKKIAKKGKIKYLFVGQHCKKLSYQYVSYLLRVVSKKAFGHARATPHVLRHSFATHLLQSGAGLRQIQLLLGHKSISSTQVYINLNQKHLKEEYGKYHPLENELYFDVYGREKALLTGKLNAGIMLVEKKS